MEDRQRQEEAAVRRVQEPEKIVQESIYRFFRDSDRREPPVKSRYPPPAHTSKPPQPPPDKTVTAASLPKLAEPSFNLSGYVPSYLKEPPPQAAKMHDRGPYGSGSGGYHDHREKPSVIIQPESKYDKGPPPAMTLSPKHRPPERVSPYPPSSAYKPHDPTPAPSSAPPPSSAATLHRSVVGHHPSTLPHGVELVKARPPSSPHQTTVPGHPDRYYSSGGSRPPTTTSYPSRLIDAGLVPNPIHVSSVAAKAKVGSPPPQVYGKPGITSGTPVCRQDTRPAQPVPLTSKAPTPGPPPAHSGRPAHPESRPPPLPPHEPRPYDARIYPPPAPSPHHKHVVAPGPPVARLPPTSSPHLPHHPSLPPQPTQTQPLDLNTREDTASPAKRRTATPSPQDTKKARYDPSVAMAGQPPLLSRVSEPSPLYPTAATTITTVENPVALVDSLPRVASPVSRPPSRPSAAGTPTATPPQPTRAENSSPPGSRSTSEPEKSVSPGPVGGYVHKLKKAWLQRHENAAEPLATLPTLATSLAIRVSTPPPTTTPASSPPAKASPAPISTAKMDTNKPGQRKSKLPNNIPNGHSQEAAAGGRDESSSSDSEGGSTLGLAGMRTKRGKAKRKIKKVKRGSGSGGGGSDTNSDSDKDSDGSETTATKGGGGRLPAKPDVEPKKRGRKPKTKQEKEREDGGPKAKKIREDAPPGDPLQKPPVAQLKKTGESFLQDGSCYEVAPKLPKCRECRWTPHQRNKKMPNIFCRFYAFRRLRYTKNGQLAVAGFSDPIKDAFGDDLKLWVPDVDNPPVDLDVDTSKFLLTHVGDQFCDLVEQEKEAMALHMGDG